MSGLACSYPGCSNVSNEGALGELEEDGWIVLAPLDRKPVAICPYCP